MEEKQNNSFKKAKKNDDSQYLSSFGSFKSKASIRRKGAGMSKSNLAYYAQLEAEAELKEAKEKQKLLEE